MLKKISHYFIAIVAILVLWQLLSLLVQKNFFPGPIETLQAFVALMGTGELLKHLIASTYRISLGTLFGMIFALPLGLLLGCSRRVDAYVGNIFNILYPIPKVVFLPIIVVCMGIGDEPKIFLIALVIFFQLTLTIRDSVRHIPADLSRSMKAINPNGIQYIVHLVIPASLPEVLSALRGTLGVSTALLFITENFASITGLGYFITKCMDARDFGDMYAGILTLALLGVVLYMLIRVSEKYICRWKYVETGAEEDGE